MHEVESATGLRSMEMLLGIISFSPGKGRGEESQLLTTLLAKRLCPGVCVCTLSHVCHFWKSDLFPWWLWVPLLSRAGTAAPAEGLWPNRFCPWAEGSLKEITLWYVQKRLLQDLWMWFKIPFYSPPFCHSVPAFWKLLSLLDFKGIK